MVEDDTGFIEISKTSNNFLHELILTFIKIFLAAADTVIHTRCVG